MPFCPSCRAEYIHDVSVCPDCGVALLAKLETVVDDEDMRDVFVCYDKPLADRLMLALSSAGLSPLLRDKSDYTFPTNIGTTAEQRIAVPDGQHRRALALLQEVAHDGIIAAEDGTLLTDTSPP